MLQCLPIAPEYSRYALLDWDCRGLSAGTTSLWNEISSHPGHSYWYYCLIGPTLEPGQNCCWVKVNFLYLNVSGLTLKTEASLLKNVRFVTNLQCRGFVSFFVRKNVKISMFHDKIHGLKPAFFKKLDTIAS